MRPSVVIPSTNHRPSKLRIEPPQLRDEHWEAYVNSGAVDWPNKLCFIGF